MADDEALIAEAVATLATEDLHVARDAEAALGWLTGGDDLTSLTQERLQHFLWYGLPMKWLTDTDHHWRVAAALGRALDLLGLPRYAELCRSPTTLDVLDAYERSDADGKRAFRKAELASGIRPPDLDELEWGPVMGIQEAAALSSTADMLELAVATGDLVPGGRGWRQRQQGFVRAHLTAARIELHGRTMLDAILDERIETWLDRRSPTRRRLLEPLAGVVRLPADLPGHIDDPIPPLQWLLDKLVAGQPLTKNGNLSRAFVQDAAGRFGWWDRLVLGLPRSEGELYDLHQVRRFAQRQGFARRSGGTLLLTANGRAALDDPARLWRSAAHGLLPEHAFAAAVGEVALAVLVSRELVAAQELEDVLSTFVAEEGWHSLSRGIGPDVDDISWAWHETTNLLRALNLLSHAGDDWPDRTYGLSAAGRAVALEALHHRAVGPRLRP